MAEVSTAPPASTPPRRAAPSAYGFILGFGIVSLLMDIVYEGALSVQGPLLASLGASAVVVGFVSGLGEATALVGRLFSGPLADRTGRYWLIALGGYAITAVAVPAMGLVGSLAAVSTFIVIERFGKSLRTPARDSMLANAASVVGRGRGFAIHEMLDQIGAVAGPLLVAAILAATAGSYAPALGVLIVPGAAAIVLLLVLRHRVPDPRVFEPGEHTASAPSVTKAAPLEAAHIARLPRMFWAYSVFGGLVCAGIATFAVMSYHMVVAGIVDAAAVPVLYAVAMGVDAIAALATGLSYDKFGPRALLVLPVIAATIPWFAYQQGLWAIIVGVVLWGLTLGIQESTLRAAVADMVPVGQRATAYGMFAVTVGIGTLLGGWIAGGLYDISIAAIIGWTIAIQAVAFCLLVVIVRRVERHTPRRGTSVQN